MLNDRIKKLLEILFDKSAREDERHDAAMYLYDYDDSEVVNAFFKIGSDKDELLVLLDAVGEGIGEMWARNDICNLEKFKMLTDISRDAAINTIKNRNPKLLKMKI